MATTYKRKMRKFSDGGETIDDDKTVDQVKAEQSDDPIRTLNRLRGGDDEGEVTEGRNSNIGDDTRSRAMAWLAKQATSKPSTSKATRSAGAGRGSVNPDTVTPTSDRRALNNSESYKRTDYSRPAEEPGLENMSADFIGGPLKAAGKVALGAVGAGLGLFGAKKLLQRGAKSSAEEMVRRGSPEIGYESAKRIGTTVGKGKELPAPPRQLPAPKADVTDVTPKARKFVETPSTGAKKPGTFKRTKPEEEVPSAGRESVTNKASWAAGPKGKVERDAVMDREAWSAGPRGALGKKKGGSIKSQAFAKGGAVRGWGKARGARSAKIV
jgi:hypothetical protein